MNGDGGFRLSSDWAVTGERMEAVGYLMYLGMTEDGAVYANHVWGAGSASGLDGAAFERRQDCGSPVLDITELQLQEAADCDRFVADDGEYAADVILAARRPVTDFALMSLCIREVYDDGTISYCAEPLYSAESLMPERPLVVRMSFPGDIPAYGISYVDSGDGMTHCLTVEIRGEDGSLMLREAYGGFD